MTAELLERLEAEARSLGVVGMGVTGPEPFDEVRRTMDRRAATGESADLGFTYKDRSRATTILESYPSARSIVSVAWPYVPAAGSPARPAPGMGRVARFAERNHYESLRRVLDRLVATVESEGHAAWQLADDDRLVDRAAAVRAGVGWWGKSTMVLVPGAGPWVLLGSVVTDAALPRSEPTRRDCGTCAACLPACPTGALVAPGQIDARKCIAYWAQAPGVIPRRMRALMGDRLYGCDECLTACPPGHPVLGRATDVRGTVDLAEVLGLDDTTLMRRFSHFYVPRREARHLRRNAIIALGNVGGRSAFGVLAGYLGHPDWLLRAHAAWALQALDHPRSEEVLSEARRSEEDPRVLAELEHEQYGIEPGLR
jgi:epoxyqueuosine reductase